MHVIVWNMLRNVIKLSCYRLLSILPGLFTTLDRNKIMDMQID